MIWDALFNAQPEANGNDFLVSVISSIGLAAVWDKLIIGILAMILLVAVVLIILRSFKNRSLKSTNPGG